MLPTPAPTSLPMVITHVLHFGSVGILLHETTPTAVTCDVAFLFVFTQVNTPRIHPPIVYHNFMASLSLSRAS